MRRLTTTSSMTKPKLTVPERHQLKVARDTLKMNPAMVAVMGGPSVEEAKAIIKRLSSRRADSC